MVGGFQSLWIAEGGERDRICGEEWLRGLGMLGCEVLVSGRWRSGGSLVVCLGIGVFGCGRRRWKGEGSEGMRERKLLGVRFAKRGGSLLFSNCKSLSADYGAYGWLEGSL